MVLPGIGLHRILWRQPLHARCVDDQDDNENQYSTLGRHPVVERPDADHELQVARKIAEHERDHDPDCKQAAFQSENTRVVFLQCLWVVHEAIIAPGPHAKPRYLLEPPLAPHSPASCRQVAITLSGLSEIEEIPWSASHRAKSGWSLGPWPQMPTYLPCA